MEWFWTQYLSVGDRTDPHISPLKATEEQLKGLPSALIIVDENDVLRDEGEAYAHKLMKAGVSTMAVRVLGTLHDFCMIKSLRNTNPTRLAVDILTTQLRRNLQCG
jgi:acetyl esterase